MAKTSAKGNRDRDKTLARTLTEIERAFGKGIEFGGSRGKGHRIRQSLHESFAHRGHSMATTFHVPKI